MWLFHYTFELKTLVIGSGFIMDYGKLFPLTTVKLISLITKLPDEFAWGDDYEFSNRYVWPRKIHTYMYDDLHIDRPRGFPHHSPFVWYSHIGSRRTTMRSFRVLVHIGALLNSPVGRPEWHGWREQRYSESSVYIYTEAGWEEDSREFECRQRGWSWMLSIFSKGGFLASRVPRLCAV